MAKLQSDKPSSLPQFQGPTSASAAESDADPYPLVATRGKSLAEVRVIVERSGEVIKKLGKRREQLEGPIHQQIVQIEELEKRQEELVKAAQDAGNPAERAKLLEEAKRLQVEIEEKETELEKVEGQLDEFQATEGHARTASQAALVALGFPVDCWMPTALAESWQGNYWPKEASAEAIRQLRELMEEIVNWRTACGDRETSQRIRAELKGNLELLRKHDPRLVPPVGAKTVWHHGERSYSFDGSLPVVVSQEEANILTAFLEEHAALDTKTLEDKGVSNVSRVIKQLEEKFPHAVRKPQRKGEGYYICVRLAPEQLTYPHEVPKT
jgi:hypothetical protein